MRRCWPAKQGLWLGPGGYRGRCRYTFTNGVTNAYANRNSYAVCMRTDSVANTNGERYADRNSHSDSHQSNANGYGDLYARTDAYPALSAISEASSDGSAAPDPITLAESSNAGTHEQNSRVPRLWRIDSARSGQDLSNRAGISQMRRQAT